MPSSLVWGTEVRRGWSNCDWEWKSDLIPFTSLILLGVLETTPPEDVLTGSGRGLGECPVLSGVGGVLSDTFGGVGGGVFSEEVDLVVRGEAEVGGALDEEIGGVLFGGIRGILVPSFLRVVGLGLGLKDELLRSDPTEGDECSFFYIMKRKLLFLRVRLQYLVKQCNEPLSSNHHWGQSSWHFLRG